MKHSKVHSNFMEFCNHMQCNVDTLGARFKFTAGLLYTFLFQDGMKFYQAEKKGNHTQLLHVTEPTFSSQPRSRIVVIDRHVDDAIALFPKMTSLFIVYKSNRLYDESSFKDLKNLMSFQWPDRPTLEKNVQTMILKRVFTSACCPKRNHDNTIFNHFSNQQLFDKHLIHSIFRFIDD